jgi:hypothetical protein
LLVYTHSCLATSETMSSQKAVKPLKFIFLAVAANCFVFKQKGLEEKRREALYILSYEIVRSCSPKKRPKARKGGPDQRPAR